MEGVGSEGYKREGAVSLPAGLLHDVALRMSCRCLFFFFKVSPLEAEGSLFEDACVFYLHFNR